MLFSSKCFPSKLQSLRLGQNDFTVVTQHKHLGLIFTSNLTWSVHLNAQLLKCNKILSMLRRFKYPWSRKALETCYLSFICPIIEYCDILYDNCLVVDSGNIESMQVEAACLVLGAKRLTSICAMYNDRRTVHKFTKMYSIVNNIAPKYLCTIFNTLVTWCNVNQKSCFPVFSNSFMQI